MKTTTKKKSQKTKKRMIDMEITADMGKHDPEPTGNIGLEVYISGKISIKLNYEDGSSSKPIVLDKVTAFGLGNFLVENCGDE